MRASVIIPVFNQSKHLNVTLRALENQELSDGYCFDVIVIDDGSHIPISNYVVKDKYSFDLQIVSQKNMGRSAARNAGVSLAKSDIIIFCDSDRFPDTRFVQKHLDAHKDNIFTVAIGLVKEVYVSDIERVLLKLHENKDYYMKKSHIPAYCRSVYEIYDTNGKTNSGIPWVSTFSGNMSISKKSFDMVNGFDLMFSEWGLEHFDLGYRLWKSGCIFLKNDATNFHISHRRNLVEMNRNIKSSIAYMIEKYQDTNIQLFGRFMLEGYPLQLVEINKNAEWIKRVDRNIIFHIGDI